MKTLGLAEVYSLKVENLNSAELVKVDIDNTLISVKADYSSAINAANYGAIGDLIYTTITYETVGIISGSDATAGIQLALNFAGSLVSNDINKEFEGQVVCFIPAGNYYISQTLVVPPNVVLHSEGMLFNFISDPYAPIVKGSRHSHCRKLNVHANAKTGIQWGDSTAKSSPCASRIEELVVWHSGTTYDATEDITVQKAGLRLFGLDFRLGNIWIKGGNIGLHILGSDVLCANLFLIGCSTGLVLESCEQIDLPSVRWDTNINQAVQIDNSNNIYISGSAFVNSDAYGTAMQAGVVIGKYSSNICKQISIHYNAQSTGGYGLDISNAQDCAIELNLSNSKGYSQTSGGGTANSHWIATQTGALLSHNIGTNYFFNLGNPVEETGAAINFGIGLSGYLDIRVIKNAVIALYQGTQYGDLRSHTETAYLRSINGINTTPLIPTNNLSELANTSIARTNLGLGSSATLNIGMTAGTVALGDDPRFTNARIPTGSATGDLTGSYPNPTLTLTGITAGTYPKLTIDNKGRATAGASLVTGDIPNLDTSKITTGIFAIAFGGTGASTATNARTNLGLGSSAILNTGTATGTVALGDDARFTNARIPTGAATGDLAGSYPNPTLTLTGITAGTYPKLTVDNKGRATAGTSLAAIDIPNLDASKITSGIFAIISGGTGASTATGARTNLGLGNSAILNTGTATGTVALGDDSRFIDARIPTGAATGDLAGSYPNPTLTLTGITAGTYPKLTVDNKGRATAGTSLAAIDIPNLDAAKISTGIFAIANGGTGASTATNARTNLGLGNSAILNTGTITGTVALGDDPRFTDARIPTGNAAGDLAGSYPNPTLTLTGITAGTYPKLTVDNKGRATAGASLATADIPSLDASKITSGVFAISSGGTGASTATNARTNLGLGSSAILNTGTATGTVALGDDPRFTNARIPTGSATGDLTGSYPNPTLTLTGITAGTYPKLTIDNKGRATAGASLVAADIPNLDAAKISSGVFAIAFGGTGASTATNARTNLGLGVLSTANDASGVPFTATGVTATNVQSAIAELDAQNVKITGNQSIDGNLSITKVLITAGRKLAFSLKTGDYTALNTDHFIAVDATLAARVIILPSASVVGSGTNFTIQKVDSTSNIVTITTTSNQTINGSTTLVFSTAYTCFTFISNGSNWLAY